MSSYCDFGDDLPSNFDRIECKRLRAENARLREALQECLRYSDLRDDVESNIAYPEHSVIAKVRAALSKDKP